MNPKKSKLSFFAIFHEDALNNIEARLNGSLAPNSVLDRRDERRIFRRLAIECGADLHSDSLLLILEKIGFEVLSDPGESRSKTISLWYETTNNTVISKQHEALFHLFEMIAPVVDRATFQSYFKDEWDDWVEEKESTDGVF